MFRNLHQISTKSSIFRFKIENETFLSKSQNMLHFEIKPRTTNITHNIFSTSTNKIVVWIRFYSLCAWRSFFGYQERLWTDTFPLVASESYKTHKHIYNLLSYLKLFLCHPRYIHKSSISSLGMSIYLATIGVANYYKAFWRKRGLDLKRLIFSECTGRTKK